MAFLTPNFFLRLVASDQDPQGNLDIAEFVSKKIGGAKPAQPFPLEIEFKEFVFHIEIYERIFPTSQDKPPYFEVGMMLAKLHSIPVESVSLRPMRRLDAARYRLSLAPKHLQKKLAKYLDEAEEALQNCTSPKVLCHADPHDSNLMQTSEGLVWIDFEYAGIAPASADLGFIVAHLIRLENKEKAQQLISGYINGGGEVDVVNVLLMAGLKEVSGLIDFSYQNDAWTHKQFEHRLHSFEELFRSSKWKCH